MSEESEEPIAETACDWWAEALDGFSRSTAIDLPYYRTFLAEERSEHVVELGAGTGRLSLPLISDGYRYTAVERIGVFRKVFSRRLSAFSKGGDCTVLEDFAACSALQRWQHGRTTFILPYNVAYFLSTPEDVAKHIGIALDGGCCAVFLDLDDIRPNESPVSFSSRRIIVGSQAFAETVCPAPDDSRIVRVTWTRGSDPAANSPWSFSLRLHRAEEIVRAVEKTSSGRWRITQHRLAPAGPDLLLRIGPPR